MYIDWLQVVCRVRCGAEIRHTRYPYAWVTGSRLRYVMLLTLFVMLPLQIQASSRSFEPDVSSADQRLLQAAIEIGETNALAAASSLETGEGRSAAVAFMAGNFYFQAEAYSDAIRAYEDALERFPGFRAAKVNLGRVHLLEDFPEKTISLYQSLVSDGQADAETYLLLGHALQMMQRPVSAETAFRNALLLEPEKVDALIGLTQALLEQERYQEALSLTGEILSFTPDKADLWRLRANAMLMLSQYDEAIRAIETAKRLMLADAEMLALQGDLFLQRDQPKDALAVYLTAFEAHEPTPARALRAMEGFLYAGDVEGMEQLLSALDIDAWPSGKQGVVLRYRAQLAMQQEDLEQAEDLAQQAVTMNPLDGGGLLLLASIAEAQGKLARAIMYCERAARIPDYAVDAWVRQAQIEVSRNRIDEAIVLLESAQSRREQPHVGRYLEQLRRMQRQ